MAEWGCLFVHSENMSKQFPSPLSNFIIQMIYVISFLWVISVFTLFQLNSKDSCETVPIKHPKVIFTHYICFPYSYSSRQLWIIQQCQPGSSHLYVVTYYFVKKQFLHFKCVQTSMKIVWSHNCHNHYKAY